MISRVDEISPFLEPDIISRAASPRELRARIKARLRQPATAQAHVVRFADCVLDFPRAELTRGGKPIELTPTEYRLLKTFVENECSVGLTRVQNRSPTNDEVPIL